MTLRWLISISLLITNSAAETRGASLAGSVRLNDSRDPRVSKKKDYSGVAVWLEPLDSHANGKAAAGRARMIQKDKTFIPHVLAVTTGTTVDFPNYDPIFHNAFSNYSGQIFDIGLYPPGKSRSVRFSRPGIVRVFCNIHAEMSAVIVVLDTPWYQVTGPDGTFSFENVPPGKYRLAVFHERASTPTLKGLVQVLNLQSEAQTLPTIVISESGYLAVPHTNKYGRDYLPEPGDEIFYPSVRK